MTQDFEKDLLTSLASNNKFDLYKISKYFPTVIDADKHIGLLVQIKSPQTVRTDFLFTEHLVLIPTEEVVTCINQSEKINKDLYRVLNQGVIFEGPNKTNSEDNLDFSLGLLAMMTKTIFNNGYIPKSIEGAKEVLGKDFGPEKELFATIELVNALSSSIIVRSIDIVGESLAITIDFSIKKFNNFETISKIEAFADDELRNIIPFQIVIGGYTTQEQYDTIKSIVKDDMYNYQNLAKDGAIHCDCPGCQMERMLKEAGIDIQDED